MHLFDLIMTGLAIYLSIGVVFALPFIFKGIRTIDQAAQSTSFAFKTIIFPGAIMLWPILLKKWMDA